MAFEFGVMQGRLLPKLQGRYQAHPINYWQDEFPLAHDLGLRSIEFIFDFNDFQSNPLMQDKGITDIRLATENSGVSVTSICADYYMEQPFHHLDLDDDESWGTLNRLVKNAQKLGVEDIVFPFVDSSSLTSQRDIDGLLRNLDRVHPIFTTHKVNFAIESDLAPEPFAKLLGHVESQHVTVNYDSGNSTSLGYCMREEFDAYGRRISDIHIKDRLQNGGSVTLGEGDVDFLTFADLVTEIEFSKPLIMQAYRDDEGLAVFKKQLKFVHEIFNG